MSDHVKEISQAHFDAEVMLTHDPVVLDFFSTECPPCEALAPKYDAVAEQLAGKVRFLKIYRQSNRELAQKLA